MQKLKLLLLLVGITGAVGAIAQNYPLFSTAAFNPYVYNSAEVVSDYATLNVHYRKQWTDITGAPSVSAATFTSRMGESRSGIGLKFSNAVEGLINSSDLQITYGYQVGLSKTNTLNFGLSAGAATKTVDVEKLAMDDPALGSYLNTSVNPIASFGLMYKSENGLNLGVALPALFNEFKKRSESNSSFRQGPTDEILFTGYFSGKLNKALVQKKSRGVKRKVMTKDRRAPIELFSLYRYSRYFPGQAELTARFNFSDHVALAAGYRQRYGFLSAATFNIQSFTFTYSYEPYVRLADFTTTSHEIHIGLRFGKERKFRSVTPALKSRLNADADAEHVARFQQSEESEPSEENKPVRMYYVVVQSFKDFTKADEFKAKTREQKFNGDVIYDAKSELYYVFLYKSTNQSAASKETKNLRAYTKYKSARLIAIE